MKISVPTNHNFYEESPLVENQLKDNFGAKNKKESRHITEQLFSSTYHFTTKKESLEQIKIFGFKVQRNKLEDEEQFILKLYAKESNTEEKKYIIQTGLFAGTIYHKDVQFNIVTPYGDTFLKRMLNFVNDIYVDNQSTKADKTEETNEFQNIIAFLFIQSLEKAAVLGLPKNYKSITERSNKVRGKIDLNAYLKRDIPFTGNLTSTYREQAYIQEIIDVLYVACKALEKRFGKEIHKKILGVYQLLKQNYSGVFPHNITIEKAKNHFVLQNPMFSAFKKTLGYAEIILKEQNLLVSKTDNKLTTNGYLFDISQLFEVYLEKLLSRYFTDWYVTGQEELNVYKKMFYKRKMFPDLVMKHKLTNQIMVFDAKFKKMRLHNASSSYSDLDRSDFYQIHSYIQYYQPNVIAGGLLYPLTNEINIDTTYSENLFDNKNIETKFIVDGIHINKEMSMSEINEKENEFLLRIESLIKEK
ncbi:5-methylcytosine restriction system specificity protein McrC [Tenacibaculum mesophilum]|uniref:5-methylcytosine restriction system specificity protein McrC n=1 Tax=Tenacibaculum mesophilum TaxID=104268 RepID=UPI003F63C180